MSELPEFVLDRVFDAPAELVWKAWTEPDLLAQWYGPNVETIIHRFELEVGGVWLNEMKMSQGSSYQKVVFKEVVAPERLVWHHYSSVDAGWQPVVPLACCSFLLMAIWPSGPRWPCWRARPAWVRPQL